MMYEQDSDSVIWGVDLRSLNPFTAISTPGYCDPMNQTLSTYSYDPIVTGFYDEEYARDDNARADHSATADDEFIARCLQEEEFSQLPAAEASGSSPADEEGEGASDIEDSMQPSSSCSSPEQKYDEEDWPLQLVDNNCSLDGKVGKILNQMSPVPHVPRINGEIPSVDEATSDHQRLLDRLCLYELVELKVQGDGNCQFRALSDQFYRTPDHHKFVREQIINQLKTNREIYEGYVPMPYMEYLKKLSKDGEWGDHVTLQAAADSYGVKIVVITSFKDTCCIEILPNIQKSNRVITLSFWAEVHYNSIYPGQDLSASETKKKKRWKIFGNKN